ncbi:MAG: hypothetical protein RL477_351 [Pseudomonadota bacterium]
MDGRDKAPAKAAQALGAFVAELRALYAREREPGRVFEAARGALGRLLGDVNVAAAAKNWPVCDRENWLFYEDPDYGFVVDGLVKAPGQATSIHDHGAIWVLYGVLSGGEDICHYRRTDGGTGEGPARIEETGRSGVRPGVLDLVAPYAIHSEQAGEQGSVAVILRSARPDRIATGRFDAPNGCWRTSPGIRQVPMEIG